MSGGQYTAPHDAKQLATLQAEAALAGYSLERLPAGHGFELRRWNERQELADLDAVALCLADHARRGVPA